jgi:RND family efflux transporter MFP subunit
LEPHKRDAEIGLMFGKQARLRHVGILALIVIGIVGVGAYCVNGRISAKPQQDYETVAALKRDVGAVVQATGIVKAMVGAEVKVGARTPGKVVELPINVGDKVDKGQVIARIEQDDLVAKVKLQRAVLAEARADEIRLARDFERYKQLSATHSISPQKLDESEAQYEMAKARTHKYQAELDYHESQFSYATIIAPIKGTVASVNTIQGETVVTGLNAPTFIKIIDLDRLEVLAYVDENDVGKVRIGQGATFTVAAHPDTEFQGQVTSIYPSATTQDNVVYYLTSVSVDNREGKLRPDMTANVHIFVDQRKGVVTVPQKAVKRDGNRKFVYVADKGARQKRFVTVGLKDQSYLEIQNGLKEGELVIVDERVNKESAR